MTTFIIKSSLSLIVLFGLYWFLLRKEKLFIFIRVFLIFSVIFSLALPFISIPISIQESKSQVNMLTSITNAIPVYDSEQNTFSNPAQPINETYLLPVSASEGISYSKILILVYIAGVLLLLVRFIRNILFLSRQMRISEKITYSGQRLVLTNHQVNPFCFFNTIFVSKQDYLNDKLAEELLSHEIEHIRQSHSTDVIFIELVKIIYWFNPILILYSKAIRENHEYLADNAVTQASSDIKSYAEKLINYISSKRNIPLTSGFNPSLTRKRLLMLTKSKSRMVNYGTKVFVTISFVIALFMMLSFTRSYSKPFTADQEQNQFSGNRSENTSEIDSNPFQTISANTLIKKSKSGIISNQATIGPQKIVKGFVVNKYGKYIEGSMISVSGKNTRVVTDAMGHFILSKVTEDDSLTFSHKGYITQTIKPVFSSEMVIRFIIENESGLAKEKIISTYLPNFETNPLIIIDSVPLQRESMFNIDPANRVNSLIVLKGKEATDKYGEKGKNGIIEIFTMGNTFGNSEKTRSETPKVEKLLIVDGVVSTKKLNDIPMDSIQIFRVLGNVQATNKYGEKGINGAIEISTKGKSSVPTEIMSSETTKTEPQDNMIDFSGKWALNLSKSKSFLTEVPSASPLVITISQDKNSVTMYINISVSEVKPLNRTEKYDFNKSIVRKNTEGDKSTVLTCTPAPDGQSFSITEISSGVYNGVAGESRRISVYTLSKDGKNLIVKIDTAPHQGSITPEDENHETRVFDRVI